VLVIEALNERGPKSLLAGRRLISAHVAVYIFVIVPFAAMVAAVPVAWGWGLTWIDVALAALWYAVTCLGVTVGFHRYFMHGSFKAKRSLRVALAVIGSMAVQGPVLHWVADHRRHHAFSDQEGDPYSPWLFGTSPAALARGFWHRTLVGCSIAT
jgi:stearoyl-CoA desaturase (Delta-9 desaturase)